MTYSCAGGSAEEAAGMPVRMSISAVWASRGISLRGDQGYAEQECLGHGWEESGRQ